MRCSTLANDSHAAPERLQTLQDLQTGLKEPFLFVVAGEVKAGKSSLLNASSARDFCRVDVLPATDRVNVFKYGEQARDVPVSPSLIERYQPVNFLRDFNIVDTPGTNTIVADHQTITEQFVPQADLIVFVFSVVNPWGASAWQFLELLQKRWLKNVIFVLQQQMDLRDETEVQAVIQHLRQTAMTRFGQSFPIFPVSAKESLYVQDERRGQGTAVGGEQVRRRWKITSTRPSARARCAAPSSRASRRPRRWCSRTSPNRRAAVRASSPPTGSNWPACARPWPRTCAAQRPPGGGISARHRHRLRPRRAKGRADS